MPSLADRIIPLPANYSPAPVSPPPPTQLSPEASLVPIRNPLLRFTAPYIAGTFPSSDTLTGFHLGGKIPQFRVPIPPTSQSAGTTTTTNTTVVNSSSSSTVTALQAPLTAHVSVPSLNPGDEYQASATLQGTSWSILSVSVAFPCRVRLYVSSTAQISDASRPATQGPGFGTESGIILDVSLDTTPVVWVVTPTTVANNSQKLLYVTVDNIGSAVETGQSVGFTYAQLTQ